MKKALLAVLLVIIFAAPLSAVDYGEGRMKLGAILGYPIGATFGLPLGGGPEMNLFAGYDFQNWYTFKYRTALFSTVFNRFITGTNSSGAFYLGGNVLFTLVDIDIEGSTFPLSLGPQVGVSINGNGDGNVRLDLMANLRWEYTFSFPLNLFVELGMGAGINFNFKPLPVQFRVNGGLGVRYVF